MNRFTCCLCALASIWLIVTCSDNGLTGPSTEQGNPQIAVVVVDSQRRPVDGAAVTAYRMPGNNDSTLEPSSAINVAIRFTDNNGACRFDNIAAGIYSLSAIDSAENRSGLIPNIVVTGPKPSFAERSDTIEIVAPATLRGVVTRGGVKGSQTNQNLRDGFIQVKIGEVDRSTTTGPDGKYFFDKLPAGVYTLYYYSMDALFYTAKRDKIDLTAGADTTVDSVILRPKSQLLPPQGLSAAYDTAAAIVRLRWQRVQFDSLRWYEVERVNLTTIGSIVTICQDTAFVDTVASLPVGTTLSYVVRSVDKAFNRSANAGPVEIIIAGKH